MDENHRVRKTLKNPVVMVGLCLLAGIAIYSNLQEVFDATMVTTTQTTKPGALPSSSATQPYTTPSSLHLEELTWVDHPDRDPFASKDHARKNPASRNSHRSETLPISAANSPTQIQPRFILKAVAIEDQNRSAVINRNIVYEGETIEGYKVLTIQPKGVWLGHNGKKQFLTFSDSRPS